MKNNYEDNKDQFSFQYWILRIILQLMAYIPFRIGHILGNLLGSLALHIPISRKSVSVENIQKSLGSTMTEAEVFKLNSMIYRHFGRVIFELPHMLRIDKDNIKKYFTVESVILIQDFSNLRHTFF